LRGSIVRSISRRRRPAGRFDFLLLAPEGARRSSEGAGAGGAAPARCDGRPQAARVEDAEAPTPYSHAVGQRRLGHLVTARDARSNPSLAKPWIASSSLAVTNDLSGWPTACEYGVERFGISDAAACGRPSHRAGAGHPRQRLQMIGAAPSAQQEEIKSTGWPSSARNRSDIEPRKQPEQARQMRHLAVRMAMPLPTAVEPSFSRSSTFRRSCARSGRSARRRARQSPAAPASCC